MRRISIALTLLLSGAAAFMFASPSSAGSSVEATFTAKLNAERRRAGLEPLAVYWDLEDDAQKHAQWMASAGRTAAMPDRDEATTGWTRMAEFDGIGMTIDEAVDGALRTEPFRTELVTTHDRVGVGIAQSDSGRLWVSVLLMTTCPK